MIYQDFLVQRTDPTVPYPIRSSEDAAGWDLYAHAITINTEARTATIDTGIKVAFPPGNVMLLFARSGLGTNLGLTPANAVGVIDADYRGPVMVKFRDLTPAAIDRLRAMRDALEPERIVQAVFVPVVQMRLRGVLELPETVRGEGGFGSTGIK